ncbi:MAG: type II toxin-antitoxin system Phd/YefM family antitoxin [Solirubrobacteraceae bacterium]
MQGAADHSSENRATPSASIPGGLTFERFATTVGIRALAKNVSGVVSEVAESGRPAVITKHGVPVAMVVPIGDVQRTAFVTRATRYLEDILTADRREDREPSTSDDLTELRRLADSLDGPGSLASLLGPGPQSLGRGAGPLRRRPD